MSTLIALHHRRQAFCCAAQETHRPGPLRLGNRDVPSFILSRHEYGSEAQGSGPRALRIPHFGSHKRFGRERGVREVKCVTPLAALAARRIQMAAIAFCILLGTAIAAPPLVHAASSKYAAIVVDHKTGKVLFSRNADAPRYPASLTRVMTLYLVCERLEAGKLTLDTPLTVSANAAAEPPTKLGLKPGSTITVEQAILALVTQSANDVATAIAENLAGSESAFARLMTQRAHQIGMTHTTF